MKLFLNALRTFTRIPVTEARAQGSISQEDDWGIPALPAIGWVVGFILWVVSLLNGILTAELTALLILMSWVMLTGGVHFFGVNQLAGLGIRDPKHTPSDESSDPYEETFMNTQPLIEQSELDKPLTYLDGNRPVDFHLDHPVSVQGALLLAIVLLAKWAMVVALLKADLAIWLLAMPFLARIGALITYHFGQTDAYQDDYETDTENFVSSSVWLWGILAAIIVLFGAPILLLMGVFGWLMKSWVETRQSQNDMALIFGIPVELLELVGLMCLVLTL